MLHSFCFDYSWLVLTPKWCYNLFERQNVTSISCCCCCKQRNSKQSSAYLVRTFCWAGQHSVVHGSEVSRNLCAQKVMYIFYRASNSYVYKYRPFGTAVSRVTAGLTVSLRSLGPTIKIIIKKPARLVARSCRPTYWSLKVWQVSCQYVYNTTLVSSCH